MGVLSCKGDFYKKCVLTKMPVNGVLKYKMVL